MTARPALCVGEIILYTALQKSQGMSSICIIDAYSGRRSLAVQVLKSAGNVHTEVLRCAALSFSDTPTESLSSKMSPQLLL
jgi:hypothetical protein